MAHLGRPALCAFIAARDLTSLAARFVTPVIRRSGKPRASDVVADMQRESLPSVITLAIVVLSMEASSQLAMISIATDGSMCRASNSLSLATLNSMSPQDSPILQNSYGCPFTPISARAWSTSSTSRYRLSYHLIQSQPNTTVPSCSSKNSGSCFVPMSG